MESVQEFNLHSWASRNGLSEKTINVLTKEDLDSIVTLEMLQNKDEDWFQEKLNLTLGQAFLLQKACKSLGGKRQWQPPHYVRSHVRVFENFKLQL